MIKDIKVGDITNPSNRADIIIGMNTELGELSELAAPLLEHIKQQDLLDLGSVLTFKYDGDGSRRIHMIICHHLGEGGWRCAEQYVRFGLDYLWKTDDGQQYSIVRIGGGEVGKKYGADTTRIHTAIATSYLPVVLYIRPQNLFTASLLLPRPRLEVGNFVYGWNAKSGVVCN